MTKIFLPNLQRLMETLLFANVVEALSAAERSKVLEASPTIANLNELSAYIGAAAHRSHFMSNERAFVAEFKRTGLGEEGGGDDRRCYRCNKPGHIAHHCSEPDRRTDAEKVAMRTKKKDKDKQYDKNKNNDNINKKKKRKREQEKASKEDKKKKSYSVSISRSTRRNRIGAVVSDDVAVATSAHHDHSRRAREIYNGLFGQLCYEINYYEQDSSTLERGDFSKCCHAGRRQRYDGYKSVAVHFCVTGPESDGSCFRAVSSTRVTARSWI
jgi:hypothetical protein